MIRICFNFNFYNVLILHGVLNFHEMDNNAKRNPNGPKIISFSFIKHNHLSILLFDFEVKYYTKVHLFSFSVIGKCCFTSFWIYSIYSVILIDRLSCIMSQVPPVHFSKTQI